MGDFRTHITPFATNGDGDGVIDIQVTGILMMVDIVLKSSSSLDITLSRVLPDGTLREFYSTTGLNANSTLGRADFTPESIHLAGSVRVTLANAGEHTEAARVYLTIVD